MLNSLGECAFDNNFNDVKKYDLTGDNDKQKASDSESDGSSKGSGDIQDCYQKMKKEQLKKEKMKNDNSNNERKKELIVVDKEENNVVSNGKNCNDLFVFEFENDVSMIE